MNSKIQKIQKLKQVQSKKQESSYITAQRNQAIWYIKWHKSFGYIKKEAYFTENISAALAIENWKILNNLTQ